MLISIATRFYFVADKQKLVNEYENASDTQKLVLENRYGKKQLQILVENTMSENWISDNSHNCPHCKAAIEVMPIFFLTYCKLEFRLISRVIGK